MAVDVSFVQIRMVFIALLMLVAGTCDVAAQPCEPHWDTVIGNPGPGQRVYGFAVFDDGRGGGPALFAALGTPANRVMKWDGATWSQLGSTFSGIVFDLAVYDDGLGPALYAGGQFVSADGVTLNRIAKWDGKAWVSVGGGMTGGTPVVYALTVHNDGSGPALFAAGAFGNAGSVPAANIAKWNGTSWSALGAGVFGNVSSNVHALLSVGPILYVGGEFSHAGGFTAAFLVNKIAKWDGSSWTKLGEGMNFGSTVYSLAHFDDGSGGGAALYAGGTFTMAGTVAANRVARWNGTSWSAVGDGVSGSGPFVRALEAFDDGTGAALYAAGQFSTAGLVAAERIAKWNGDSWSAVGAGTNSWIEDLIVFDNGTGKGSDLYVGGEFTIAGGSSSSKIAIWRGCGEANENPGDITGDGSVDVDDLLSVINAWGDCPQPCPPSCTADISPKGGNCVVNVDDLLLVINNWG
jgi:trimeric autotransporter adhesin